MKKRKNVKFKSNHLFKLFPKAYLKMNMNSKKK